MQRTKIEWTDYTWNPVRGLCKTGCPYCYARRMHKRFKWNPEVRLDENELLAPYKLKEPSKIFVCSTHEIFGHWIPKKWRNRILEVIYDNLHHTFQILTKSAYLYDAPIYNIHSVDYYFPHNCWLGMTLTGKETWITDFHLIKFIERNIKFISLEPLLEDPKQQILKRGINWLIIGGLTPKPVHKKEWVYNLVDRAKELNIPVFLKNNLISTMGKDYVMKYREFLK